MLLATGHAAAQKPPDSPPDLKLSHWVRADLDGDGKPETAYAGAYMKPGLNAPSVRVWVMKGGRKVFEHDEPEGTSMWDRGGPPKSGLQFRDVTGDGRRELLVRTQTPGDSEGSVLLRVFRWTGVTLANVVENPERALRHGYDGGVAIRSGPRGRPSVLLAYRRQPDSRYEVERFTWNAAKSRFIPGRERISTRRGKAGLRELGVR